MARDETVTIEEYRIHWDYDFRCYVIYKNGNPIPYKVTLEQVYMLRGDDVEAKLKFLADEHFKEDMPK